MNIKKLVEVFSDHEIKAERDFRECLKSFVENNPGEELPEHMKDRFNICAALKLMCSEIALIKEKLEME